MNTLPIFGIEVETSTISRAFEEAPLGFSEIITGGNLPKGLISNDIIIESDNLDSLLVHFISYLVVLFDTDLFISGFAKIEISKGENFLLKGILKGDIYDQSKHGYGVEIKAVSYHQLLVEEGPPSRLRVILDL